jgi:hypothetical protein
MASLVVSVIFAVEPFPYHRGTQPGRTSEVVLASWTGGNITGGDGGRRSAFCGFKTTRDSRQQGGRFERLLQAGDSAKPGGHGQEIRA